jgi:PQQ enzyme repeat
VNKVGQGLGISRRICRVMLLKLEPARCTKMQRELMKPGFCAAIATVLVTLGAAARAATGPVTLSPSSLSFGNQFINATSAPQNMVLTNNQSVTLKISSITTTTDFNQTNTCGSTLAAGAACTITVTFTPSEIIVRQGSLTISDNASSSPQQVPLSGTGTQPVSLSPSNSIAFGSQPFKTPSSPQSVTVVNNQNVAVKFSSIQVFGNYQQTNTCGSRIPAESSCTVTVVFQPTAIGAATGAVELTDNASNSPQYINLSGNGVAAAVSNLTYQYNNSHSGADTSETIMTPGNVNVNQFGKLFSIPVDSGIYAQPLYVPHLTLPGLGVHNVVYVATQHNSLYAFDADNGATLWAVSLGPYQPTPQGCEQPGDVGIIGTPVIDLSSKTIYAVAATEPSGTPQQELYALDITTGAERPSSPVIITASVPGTGFSSSGGIITFNGLYEFQRPALLLDNGVLYIGFASHCDGAYDADGHGWLFAYNASTLQQNGSFIVTPNGYGGGIWASGGGPVADGSHNIYFSTGNGTFDVKKGGIDYGDSVIELSPSSLMPLDYFTPDDQAQLQAADGDLDSGGILLLPNQPISPTHLLVTAGKQGTIYLINRDNLGKYHTTTNNVVEFETSIQGLFSTPSFWNNTLYFAATGDYPKAFSFSTSRIPSAPTSQASESYPFPGSTTVVSANGETNGILWTEQHGGTASGNEVLHAYDATNLSNELYNSDQAGTRDLPGIVGKHFESIIVANGKVYVPTGQPQLTVFGLLPSQ